MNSFIRKISTTKLVKDQRGISFMEYSVLFVLVLIVCIGAWKTLGGTVVNKVGEATNKYDTELNVSGEAAPGGQNPPPATGALPGGG